MCLTCPLQCPHLSAHKSELTLLMSVFVKPPLASIASASLAQFLSWGQFCPPENTEPFSDYCNWEDCALLTWKGIDASPASECPTVHMVAFYGTERTSSARTEAELYTYTGVKGMAGFCLGQEGHCFHTQSLAELSLT